MGTQEQPALPPQVRLYQMAIGHYFSRAIALAAKLGVADLLSQGPRPIAALAEATGTQPAALGRVLRLLASVGVFEETAEAQFALTSLGECLRADVPGSARAAVMLFGGVGIQDSWKELEYCVQTGEPAFRKAGLTDPFEEMAKRPTDAANFDAAMAEFTRMTAIAVAAVYDFAPFRTVADIGGGNGALMIGILKAYPDLHGVVFDQPHVVERAAQQIAQSGLVERCRVAGGDFFAAVPSGADAYLLKHVIHDWNDERAGVILQACRRAMGTQGTLLLVEGVYPAHIDQSAQSRGAAANDVNMLVSTGGRQRSEAEFRALYQQAGFRLARIVPTPSGACVIEGVPV